MIHFTSSLYFYLDMNVSNQVHSGHIPFHACCLLPNPYRKSSNLLNSFSMHFLSSHFHTQLNTFLFFSISHFLTFPLFPFFSVQFQSISYFYLFYFSLLYLISWEIERIFYADSFLFSL